jgi:uncharacterized protein YabN with tetrapyrrole methylase and pyrophosphatase domain
MSSAGDEYTRLVGIVARLRAPDGCPWDREQTIDTLKKYVLEETYEILDAIDRHDHDSLREELGDFLFEAVFVAQLEEDAGHFSIAESVKAGAPLRDPQCSWTPSSGTRPLGWNRWEEIKTEELAALTRRRHC